MSRQIINITENAEREIERLLKMRGEDSLGIKVKVKEGGCSGLTYDIDYADTINNSDEVALTSQGIKIIIDPKTIMFVIGMTLDFTKDRMREGFDFINPNVKVSCGCGKSFNV